MTNLTDDELKELAGHIDKAIKDTGHQAQKIAEQLGIFNSYISNVRGAHSIKKCPKSKLEMIIKHLDININTIFSTDYKSTDSVRETAEKIGEKVEKTKTEKKKISFRERKDKAITDGHLKEEQTVGDLKTDKESEKTEAMEVLIDAVGARPEIEVNDTPPLIKKDNDIHEADVAVKPTKWKRFTSFFRSPPKKQPTSDNTFSINENFVSVYRSYDVEFGDRKTTYTVSIDSEGDYTIETDEFVIVESKLHLQALVAFLSDEPEKITKE